MITPKEIKRILYKSGFKQSNKVFSFDAGIKGLGVVNKSKEIKKEVSKSF